MKRDNSIKQRKPNQRQKKPQRNEKKKKKKKKKSFDNNKQSTTNPSLGSHLPKQAKTTRSIPFFFFLNNFFLSFGLPAAHKKHLPFFLLNSSGQSHLSVVLCPNLRELFEYGPLGGRRRDRQGGQRFYIKSSEISWKFRNPP